MPPNNYEVIWQPAPGVLFDLAETAEAIELHIKCLVVGLPPGDDAAPVEPTPVVAGYTAKVDKPQSVLVIQCEAGGVAVSARSLSGLFGIEFIDHQKDRVTTRIHRWGDLPDDADEIIEFRPSGEQRRQYQLTVIAELSNGEWSTAVFDMIINQDWTAGRDRLLGEVNARGNNIR